MVSGAEEKKCLDLSGNATAHHIKGSLRCVRGLNSRDCMVRIKVAGETSLLSLRLLEERFRCDAFACFSPQNGTADAASMSADDIYAAGLCHGLELAAGESHNGAGECRYTAMVKPRLCTEVKACFCPSRWRQLLCGSDGPPLVL